MSQRYGPQGLMNLLSANNILGAAIANPAIGPTFLYLFNSNDSANDCQDRQRA